jgi:hypothetical protein
MTAEGQMTRGAQMTMNDAKQMTRGAQMTMNDAKQMTAKTNDTK